MAEDSSLESFLKEKPEGDYTDELAAERKAVWNALRPYRLKLLRLAPAAFLHFGTTRECLDFAVHADERYGSLGWKSRVNSSVDSCAAYISVQGSSAVIGQGSYLEVSHVHGGAVVGEGSVLSYVEVPPGTAVPSHVVLHGLKQKDGRFVCRIYGTTDNPKEDFLFGVRLGDILPSGEAAQTSSLWDAQLYPVCAAPEEAVSAALQLYEAVNKGSLERLFAEWDADGRSERKSLHSGFLDADSKAVLSWNQRMSRLVEMNRIAAMSEKKVKAEKGMLSGPLDEIQKTWLQDAMEKADAVNRVRLRYYIGYTLGGEEGEEEISKAFRELSCAMLEKTRAKKDACLENAKDLYFPGIMMDTHTVSLPLRVNFGGGWSDTPPYCIENGGTVLNAAILIHGKCPVKVTLKKLGEKKIILESRDLDAYRVYEGLPDLFPMDDPYDPFAIQKAALLVCGVIPSGLYADYDHGRMETGPAKTFCPGGAAESAAAEETGRKPKPAEETGGEPEGLEKILDALGGGIYIDTEVFNIPKGSGLGTSSILAAACVKALSEFLGIPYTETDITEKVLCIEQIITTGGGWQDQVGGLTGGIKFITTRPGWEQIPHIRQIEIDGRTKSELQDRFALIYTGQRRLARNLLREIMGRYIGSDPVTAEVLDGIQRIAALMRFELERGNVDAFGKLLTDHWELCKKMDAGCTNTLIEQIFDAAGELLSGRMVCGAGGGGFLQVLLKKGVTKEMLQKRLGEVFQDTEVCVWDCEFVW